MEGDGVNSDTDQVIVQQSKDPWKNHIRPTTTRWRITIDKQPRLEREGVILRETETDDLRAEKMNLFNVCFREPDNTTQHNTIQHNTTQHDTCMRTEVQSCKTSLWTTDY